MAVDEKRGSGGVSCAAMMRKLGARPGSVRSHSKQGIQQRGVEPCWGVDSAWDALDSEQFSNFSESDGELARKADLPRPGVRVLDELLLIEMVVFAMTLLWWGEARGLPAKL